jgi:hypothetical protein
VLGLDCMTLLELCGFEYFSSALPLASRNASNFLNSRVAVHYFTLELLRLLAVPPHSSFGQLIARRAKSTGKTTTCLLSTLLKTYSTCC